MADTVSRAQRSKMMASIHGKNTKPEIRLRRYLHGLGFRYRLHQSNLPGKPDLVLPKYHVAILVHGCFWHQHDGCKYATTPENNSLFWSRKFSDNKARDIHVIERLQMLGWRVFVIWECCMKGQDAEARLDWLPMEIKGGVKNLVEWPMPKYAD